MTDHSTTAQDIAALGIRVFPVRKLDKRPSVAAWPDVATSTPEWEFDGNVGVRTGYTDIEHADGTKLAFFVVDVDVKDGQPGKESWANFCDENPEVGAAALDTVMVNTPSGGYHFWFVVPEGWNPPTNGKPWPGVDIRGEGGYVLAPPSQLDGGDYSWVRDPFEHEVVEAPEALMAWLNREPEPQVRQSGVSLADFAKPEQRDDEGPADYIRRTESIASMLQDAGWQYVENKGRDSYWCRPGKNPRDGHSAILHDDGPLVIWSTSAPMEFWRVGRDNADGSRSLSPFEVYAAINHAGDIKGAGRFIRKEMMPKAPAPASEIAGLLRDEGAEAPVHRSEAHVTEASGLNLPDEFWTARPVLEHIRTAAWSRMEAPDAVLGTMLARYAACIPTGHQIPAIVGAPATFDHLSVLVGESSGGKSVAMSIARELFAGPQFDTIVWDLPVPTGEGLIGSFFEEVMEEDGGGKKKVVNKKTKNAVHFSIDEGMALIQAGAQRQGTTIASVLCSAWTGQNPGQANASKERRRVDLKPYTFRVSGVMGIQFALGHHLLTETWVDQGLAGRLLFFSTEDTSIPYDTPPWPGRLELPIPPSAPVELRYASTIHEEVRRAHHAKKTKQVQEAPIDGHLRLVRLKISGILALLDGRTSVEDADWNLAGMVLTSSVNIRNAMQAVASEARHHANVTKATAAGMYKAIEESAQDEENLKRCVKQILARLDANPEGLTRKQLRASLSSTAVRQLIDVALEKLSSTGQINEIEGVWAVGGR